MNEIMRLLNVDPLLLQALREDMPGEDVSTNAVMPCACPGTVDLIAKQDGIVAGLDVFERVFTLLDPATEVEFFCKDGDAVKNGEKLGVVNGDIRVLLSGERVALNYLQRMSGIATYTHEVASLLEGTGITLLDTRKTSPNNRVFEKYAVRVGGGCNHRTGLSDGVLLKDNHIGAAGGVAKAVAMARAYAPFVRKIADDRVGGPDHQVHRSGIVLIVAGPHRILKKGAVVRLAVLHTDAALRQKGIALVCLLLGQQQHFITLWKVQRAV